MIYIYIYYIYIYFKIAITIKNTKKYIKISTFGNVMDGQLYVNMIIESCCIG